MVGGGDNLRIMLHHHHCIAAVTHLAQNLEQARVIPRMQSDGGLVENEEGVHQRGSESRGQVHSLHLPPGERAGLAIE